MGMVWRAMPLLSTLAALVIIAHSAEEGLEGERVREREYRYELKPRVLDTGTPGYDEPWRAIEAEPMMQETVPEDRQLAYDEPVKRRRPGRKRKRRPLPSSEEIPRERDLYHEETRYEDPEGVHDATEAPRRRRKRPGQDRPSRWTEEFFEFERPARRRNRRKRPTLESGPRLSEFDLKGEHTEENRDSEYPLRAEHPLNDDKENKDDLATGNEYESSSKYQGKVKILPNNYFALAKQDKDKDERSHQVTEDKSLSEFSEEVISETVTPKNIKEERKSIINLAEKLREKSKLMTNIDTALESGPIDPVALKEILKKSNGTSLSEILQQHNLSLTDLLHGKEDALSVLKSEAIEKKATTTENSILLSKDNTEIRHENEKQTTLTAKSTQGLKQGHKVKNGHNTNNQTEHEKAKSSESDEHLVAKENGPRIPTMRRYLGNSNTRRKLRLRPTANGTMKGQLSRDLIAQTARKYLYHNNRNSTKGKEWKQVLPSMNVTQPKEVISEPVDTETPLELETTTPSQDDKTTTETEDDDQEDDDYDAPVTTTELNIEIDTSNEQEPDELDPDENEKTLEPNTTVVITTTTEITTTEKPKVRNEKPVPSAKKTGLRRQAINNRLKRKLLRQKNYPTEPPEDDDVKDFLGLGNLVSSSELVARTQKPDAQIHNNNDEDFTSLDDFLTTASPRRQEHVKTTRISSIVYTTPKRTTAVQSTTEETAKIEIEEILNDTLTSARLSKILMERNMTLNELVEHRERGSSHVHLADIFHNASKEPNPPEPFLSKSSIEPISKETYPLRALLDANLHDPTAKPTTRDPNVEQYVHIPVVMDFGNNVNENGENIGVMSLFNKLTESDGSVENSDLKKDSEGTPYITTIISMNASTSNGNASARDGKDLKELEVTGWNKLFELMRKRENNTEDVFRAWATEESSSVATKLAIDDTDGDGLIVLEDLQHLNAFENNIGPRSDEKLDINTYQSDTTIQPGILDRLPSSTRSVTVATASIVGLAMILFLLTYAAFKWKQQRSMLRKKQSFSEERIPTPVFESRKSQKNNCSTRSMSPMLASNIYTMNTLDSRAGTESPEYMWDTLRKPFQ